MGKITRLTHVCPDPTGFISKGFENVFKVFIDSFTKGINQGASFAAYYKGKPAVHIWGGYADEGAHRPWQADTMSCFFSTTKFVAAITLAHLVDRGQVDYQQKISSFWPEFGQNGKQDITLEMLITNRAGLVALCDNFELSWVRDNPRKLAHALESQKPFWEPGESHGYHPFTFGLYLDQVVRRTDQKCRSLAQYFQEEIAQLFGIDFHIGIPKPLHYRVARLEPQEDHFKYLSDMMEYLSVDPSLYHKAFSQPSDWRNARNMNNPDFAELPCPSSHGVGTSLGIAKLAGILANGGEHEGRTLLSSDAINLLQEPISYGTDQTTSGLDIYSRGTILEPVVEGEKHWFNFGHSGYGDMNGISDPHYSVGWAFLSNYIDPTVSMTGHNKWKPLVQALYAAVHELEGVTAERRVLSSFDELLVEGLVPAQS